MTDEYQPGGWIIDAEDYHYLNSLPDERPVLQLVGHYEEVAIDPREVLKVENQGQQGACQGHSLTSCLEWCYCIETGNWELQLSRAMGYYESQRRDSISGDRGSTISGGCNLAREVGICEESLWPYPSRYDNRRPANFERILSNAKQYRVGSLRRLSTYEGVRTFLGSGQGAVNIGIGWSNGMNRSVVETYSGGGGGHAIGLFTLSERKDSQGRPYIWMKNSWGERFGNQGWSEWAPRAIEQMFRHRWTVAIGVSDMPGVEPRDFTLEDWQTKLKAG